MKATIKIQNLKSHGCANTITKKLLKLENIIDVKVDIEDQSVSFLYEIDSDLTKVISTLQQLGYPEQGAFNSIGKKAKSYVSCAVGKLG
jgi:copper chaperone CopZ